MIFYWVVGVLVFKEGVSVQSCYFEGVLINRGCCHGRDILFPLLILLLLFIIIYYFTTFTTNTSGTIRSASCIPILKLMLQILPLVIAILWRTTTTSTRSSVYIPTPTAPSSI